MAKAIDSIEFGHLRKIVTSIFGKKCSINRNKCSCGGVNILFEIRFDAEPNTIPRMTWTVCLRAKSQQYVSSVIKQIYQWSTGRMENSRAAQGEPPTTDELLDLVQEAMDTLAKTKYERRTVKVQGKSPRTTQAYPPATLRL